MSTTTADQSPAAWDIAYTVGDGIEAATTVAVAGVAVDWTGATFECDVLRGSAAGGGSVIASVGGAAAAAVTVTGNASGVLTVVIDADTSAAMGAGAFPFSVRATFSGDEPLTYVAGSLRGTLRATHD